MGLFDDADEWASEARSRLDEDAAKAARAAEARSRFTETVAFMLQGAVETLVRFDIPKLSAVLRDGSEISGWNLMHNYLELFLSDGAVLYPAVPLFRKVGSSFQWVGDVPHETTEHNAFEPHQYGSLLDGLNNPLMPIDDYSDRTISYKDFLQRSVRSAIEADTARRHAGQ